MASLKAGPSKTRKWISLALGTAFTVVLLSWALRGVSLEAVWRALQQARWEWLFLGWLAYLASYWVRAWRWGTLLSATCHPGRFRNRLVAIFIGFGANSVLPAYAGEFVRAGAIFRLDRVPMGAAVGSIFAERLLDIGVVFFFLLLPLWLGALPLHPSLNGLPLGWIGAIIILLWTVFLIGASFPGQIAQRVASICQVLGFSRFQARIISTITGFLEGLSALKQPRQSLMALIETGLVWGLNALTYWAGFVAFGLMTPSWPGALFTQSVTALAIAIPSTPGAVGPLEAGIRFSLSVYSIPIDIIIAYAITMRFIVYITIPIIAGLISFKMDLFHPALLPISGEKHLIEKKPE
jgi:glycosyltransferase 2 family protein